MSAMSINVYDPIQTIREANKQQENSARSSYSLEGELSKAKALAQLHYKNEQFIDGSAYIERAYRLFNYTYASQVLTVRIAAILHAAYLTCKEPFSTRRSILACFPSEIDEVLHELTIFQHTKPAQLDNLLKWSPNKQLTRKATYILQYEYIDLVNTLGTMDADGLYDSIRDNKRSKWFVDIRSSNSQMYMEMSPKALYNHMLDTYQKAIESLVYYNLTQQAVATK